MDSKCCAYRRVDDAGRILCDQIRVGDRQVSPAICESCPIAEIDCMHLRASLTQTARPPILVRYGNGKAELWDDPVPPLSFQQAACAIKTVPILAPSDCSKCSLHKTLGSNGPLPGGCGPTMSVPPPRRPTHAARTPAASANIIRLDEWLARSGRLPLAGRNVRPSAKTGARVQGLEARPQATRAVKTVGWTD